ncbi:MAG: hypothetical protein Q9164_007056 [Protoblastenia rupestris]
MAPIRPRKRKPHRSTITSSTSISSLKSSPSNSLTSHNIPPTHRLKTQKRISKHTALLSRLHSTYSAHSHTPSKISKHSPRLRTTRRPSKKLVTDLHSLAAALPQDAPSSSSSSSAKTTKRASAPTTTGANATKPNTEIGGRTNRIVDGVSTHTKPRIKLKSLKSRPGATKKKETLVRMERERFARSLAIMASGSTDTIRVKCKEEERTIVGATMVIGDEVRKGSGMDRAASGGDAVRGAGDGGNIVAIAGDGRDGGGATRERWAAIRRFIEGSMERGDLR